MSEVVSRTSSVRCRGCPSSGARRTVTSEPKIARTGASLAKESVAAEPNTSHSIGANRRDTLYAVIGGCWYG